MYPFIFMNAIHYKVKEDHRYVTKAAYVVLGITTDGRKDILDDLLAQVLVFPGGRLEIQWKFRDELERLRKMALR